jgi:hypothetical protein
MNQGTFDGKKGGLNSSAAVPLVRDRRVHSGKHVKIRRKPNLTEGNQYFRRNWRRSFFCSGDTPIITGLSNSSMRFTVPNLWEKFTDFSKSKLRRQLHFLFHERDIVT